MCLPEKASTAALFGTDIDVGKGIARKGLE